MLLIKVKCEAIKVCRDVLPPDHRRPDRLPLLPVHLLPREDQLLGRARAHRRRPPLLCRSRPRLGKVLSLSRYSGFSQCVVELREYTSTSDSDTVVWKMAKRGILMRYILLHSGPQISDPRFCLTAQTVTMTLIKFGKSRLFYLNTPTVTDIIIRYGLNFGPFPRWELWPRVSWAS